MTKHRPEKTGFEIKEERTMTKDLTPTQKLKLLMGKDCWHTEDFDNLLYCATVSDGPLGLRTPALVDGQYVDQPSVAYPSMQIASQSWDSELAYRLGCALADDATEKDVDVLLAPGLNIKRDPHCGRNFEYMSEDPLLTGILGREYVRGLQDNGVGATLKHYCCNNSENSRMWLSAEVDERTLREIYLKAFEIACEARPWAVMCSYNVVNGVRMAQHKKLFTLLRKKFHFGDGLIMSDWGAVTDATASVNAGLDLIMPYSEKCEAQLENAYASGDIAQKQIEENAERVIKFTQKCAQAKKTRKVNSTKEERRELARRIEEEGIVLLKNNGVLPIRENANVSLGGNFVNSYINGGGSSSVTPSQTPVTLLQALKDALPNGTIAYRDLWEYGVSEAPLLQTESAYGKDVAIICAGLHDCEGFDRAYARLPRSQEEIIKETARKNPNTVVILYCGAPVDMSDWIDDVSAVLWAGYVGEAGNLAVADVLTGKVNPSGKLTETFPLGEFDYPAYHCFKNNTVSLYSDGLLVGYRYHVTAERLGMANALPKPRFPFGYGLSYSRFEYSDVKVTATRSGVNVSYKITNTSDTDGTEISQVYVREVNPRVFRPFMELKGFDRTTIKAHESTEVTVFLPASAFAYFSVAEDRWLVEGGDYEIYVGPNSADTPLCAKITVKRQLL